jgi:uroporphyrinogen decarboxylase
VKPLLVSVIDGEPVPRRPLWIMRQAGRFLPEYRKLRESHTFEEMSGDPALAAEVTMMPLRRFELDAAIIFADLMSPVAALGIDYSFKPGPVLETPIRTRAQVEAFPDPDPDEIAPEVAAALRLVRRELSEDRALLGFVGAPMSIAAYLVQGQGGKDFPTLRAMAYGDPQLFGELLGRLARLCAGYARAQVAAGADAVQIFESWGGLLDPPTWRRLVRPHLQELLGELGAAGIRRVMFLHGAPHLIPEYAQLPAEVLAVDWRVDLAELRKELGPDRVLQGNLDPAVLLAGPEATTRAATELLSRVPRRNHIFNLGHGIQPTTPLESVAALVSAIHSEAQDPRS